MYKNTLIWLVLVSLVLGGCGLFRKKQTEEPTPRKSLLDEPVNQIAISERPYISLVPTNNGQKVILAINNLNKPAEEAEFELEYAAGDLIRGAFGSIDLSSGTGEYEVLLGSCSTGGTCSYDSDVSGGDAIISLRGNDTYAVKIAWRYQETAQAESKFGSRDQKFQVTGDNLFANSNYVIVTETSGLPETIEAEILSGPFGIYPSNGIREVDEATITMRLNQETDTAQMWGWDEDKWIELETNVEGKTATSLSAVYPVYLVTK